MFEERESFKVENMGLTYQDIDQFVTNPEINRNRLSMAFVGAGQGGGKIASEFCRFGYPLFAYNTCEEDLDALQKSIEKMDNPGKFYRLDLKGDGGSAKSRKKGLEAIKKNQGVLKETLLNIKELQDASFVWICVALGGGTGAGSLTAIATLLSALRASKIMDMESSKRIPVGVIAAVPDDTAKSRVKMNVAAALKELTQLHDSQRLGAVVLLDNQKMINEFNESYKYTLSSDNSELKTWATDGNAKIARVITELALTTGYASEDMFDRAEMLDIWGMPGFMAIGKNELDDDAMLQSYCESGYNNIPEKFEERELAFENLIKKSFGGSIFVEGTNMETAIHGGMVVISDGDVIRNGDAHTLKRILNKKVLNGAGMEETHFGFVTTKLTGTVKEPSNVGGRIFNMCVSKRVPEYIDKWCEDAIKSREEYKEARVEMQDVKSIDISTAELSTESVTTATKGLEELDLASLFAVSNDDIEKQRAENLDAFNSLFADDKKEEAEGPISEADLLNSIFSN